jgi:hypothetical protein
MKPPENHDLEARLGELPREIRPRPELEERVVAKLRERGLIGHVLSRRSPWRLAAAACLVGLLAGWLAHGLAARTPVPLPTPESSGERFLLLLSEPTPLATSKPASSLVAEYAAWARRLAAEGRLVAAERLLDGGRSLPPSAPELPSPGGADPVTGFFLVNAAGWDEALALASTCPHLAYGGRITVRQVAGTESSAAPG